MSLRGLTYSLGRLLGDLTAIRRGTIAKRLVNRWIGRNLVRRMWVR